MNVTLPTREEVVIEDCIQAVSKWNSDVDQLACKAEQFKQDVAAYNSLHFWEKWGNPHPSEYMVTYGVFMHPLTPEQIVTARKLGLPVKTHAP